MNLDKLNQELTDLQQNYTSSAVEIEELINVEIPNLVSALQALQAEQIPELETLINNYITRLISVEFYSGEHLRLINGVAENLEVALLRIVALENGTALSTDVADAVEKAIYRISTDVEANLLRIQMLEAWQMKAKENIIDLNTSITEIQTVINSYEEGGVENQQKINNLLIDFAGLSGTFSELDGVLNSLEQKVSTILKNLEILGIEDINTTLEELQNLINNYSDNIEELNNSVSSINSEMENIQGNITSISDNVTTLQTNVRCNTNNIDSVQTELNTLQHIVTEHINSGDGGISEDQLNQIQEQIQTLSNRIEYFRLPIDIYRHIHSFEDFPPETILTGYDCFNMPHFNAKFITSSNTISPISFSAQDGYAGIIDLSFDLVADNNQAVTVTLELNGNSIFEKIYSVVIDNALHVNETISNVSFLSGNILIFKVVITITGVYMQRLRVGVNAPNAMFTTTLCPFTVVCEQGNYVIGDCTNGLIKVAVIDKNYIREISDLEYIQTETAALQAYYPNEGIHTATESRAFLYVASDLSSAAYNNNKKWFSKTYLYPSLNYDYFYEIAFGSVSKGKANSNNIGNLSSLTNRSWQIDAGKMTAVLRVDGSMPFNNASAKIYIITRTDGENYIVENYLNNISVNSIGRGKNITAYLINERKYNDVDIVVYMKIGNEIVRKYITFFKDTATITSQETVGYYDWYFQGNSDDYFTVKDNVLNYYKESGQPETLSGGDGDSGTNVNNTGNE